MAEVDADFVRKFYDRVVPGIIIGKDLAYWATALRFAGALVAALSSQVIFAALLSHSTICQPISKS